MEPAIAILHGLWTIKTFTSGEDWISSILVVGSNQDGRYFITDLTAPAPVALSHVAGGTITIELQTYSLGSYDPSDPNKGIWLPTSVVVTYGWQDDVGLTITLTDGTGTTIALCIAEDAPLVSPKVGNTPPDLTIPKGVIKPPIGGIGHPPKRDPDGDKDRDRDQDRDRDPERNEDRRRKGPHDEWRR
jgi:hypothetical protein